MSLVRKKTLLERLARSAGKATAYAQHYVPKAVRAAGSGTKKAYEKSISTYEKGLILLEKAQKEQRRLKRLARKGRRTLKGKKRHKKATRKVSHKRYRKARRR